jgi:hypothetical protein
MDRRSRYPVGWPQVGNRILVDALSVVLTQLVGEDAAGAAPPTFALSLEIQRHSSIVEDIAHRLEKRALPSLDILQVASR